MDEAVVRAHPEPWNKGKLVGQLVCLLDAHHDRAQNIRFATPFETAPAISSETYIDTFGNSVRRFIAPAGDLTICRDAIIEDSGRPDPVELDARDAGVYVRQPLLRNR
jgi:hypothetical protein